MSFKNLMFSLIIVGIVFLKIGETGVLLQLVPFRECSHAVRLVPNTLELNEFIDRTLDSIGRLPKVKNKHLFTINGAYKHFSYQMSDESVPGIFQTGPGALWNWTDLVRSGNAYIYNNEEDSVQVVSKMVLKQLEVKYEQCNVMFGKVNESGTVTGFVDASQVDVRITLRVRQNTSLPLIFVCDGKVDELSLTPGDFHFTLTGLKGNRGFQTAVLDGLTNHLNDNVFPHLQTFLASSFESVVRTDEQLCYSLVLCNSCEFYAADS